MTAFRAFLVGAAVSVAPFVFAADGIEAARAADIVILGEVHDNPAHHAEQARYIRALTPRAVVYEMLTPEEASTLAAVPRQPAAMQAATEGFHWSNIADYADLLAGSTQIVGAALPRETVRAAFSEGAASVFTGETAAYGLAEDLSAPERDRRMQLQFDAHCKAMPREMMGGMVEAQRLRDAEFARTTLAALEEFGRPVVLITGNGHARRDWGVPAYLARVRPDITVFALGQAEDGAILDAPFDLIHDASPPARPDHCAAFN